MRKFLALSCLFFAINHSAVMAKEPILSHATMTCSNSEHTLTLTINNILSEAFYARQYLATLTIDDHQLKYVIVNQDRISTRCKSGWWLNFTDDNYTHFTYSDVDWNSCGTPYVHASLHYGYNTNPQDMNCVLSFSQE